MNLTNARLSPGQARSLLTQVADMSSLAILKISENDVSSVPGTLLRGGLQSTIHRIPTTLGSCFHKSSANVLAKAVNSMLEVELSKCSLTIYQVLINCEVLW